MTDRTDQQPSQKRTDGGGKHAAGDAQETLLEQMGGVVGMAYSAVPVVVFVLVNSVWSLQPAIWASLGSAVLIVLIRLVRKETLQPAFSGFFGAAIAAFIAWKSGDAKDYFLFGIYTSLLYGGVLLASVLVRWPLAGVVWNFLTGRGKAWRKDKPSLRYYDIATLAMVAVFAARFVVQKWLHDEDLVGWLAAAKIGMGFPLWMLALLVMVWAVRKSDKRLAALESEQESDEEIEERLREKYS